MVWPIGAWHGMSRWLSFGMVISVGVGSMGFMRTIMFVGVPAAGRPQSFNQQSHYVP